MKCLIEDDSNLDEQNDMGNTPLHCSMVLENLNFSSWKESIAEKSKRICNSKTTDSISYRKRYDEIVRLLIENGANINVQNNEGYTPLYLAVVFEHFKSAQLLLDAGADVNIKDNDRESVLTTTIGSGHKTAIKFLKKNNVADFKNHNKCKIY